MLEVTQGGSDRSDTPRGAVTEVTSVSGAPPRLTPEARSALCPSSRSVPWGGQPYHHFTQKDSGHSVSSKMHRTWSGEIVVGNPAGRIPKVCSLHCSRQLPNVVQSPPNLEPGSPDSAFRGL